MLSLEEKRQAAPPELVQAVDLVSACISAASRRVTDSRLDRMIGQALSQYTSDPMNELDYKVRREAIDIFHGDKEGVHAHAAVTQSEGKTFYWRNREDPHGPQNFFR